jgi:spore coat protein CotF
MHYEDKIKHLYNLIIETKDKQLKKSYKKELNNLKKKNSALYNQPLSYEQSIWGTIFNKKYEQ